LALWSGLFVFNKFNSLDDEWDNFHSTQSLGFLARLSHWECRPIVPKRLLMPTIRRSSSLAADRGGATSFAMRRQVWLIYARSTLTEATQAVLTTNEATDLLRTTGQS
jgi:hypothetical protein